MRVAEKKNGSWRVNQWVKKAILLSFRTRPMTMSKGPYTTWYDKCLVNPLRGVNQNGKKQVTDTFLMEWSEKVLSSEKM